ncbi:MAG: peptide chain release factor N(5)-glutamine methyltransferase [Deltaproteobacteria bacterium]|nr:peptide chain release factor N(5)-glutamine methyltransferase [Deltaproteobacteria bacterium]
MPAAVRSSQVLLCDLLSRGASYLRNLGVPNPHHDAEELLAFVLRRPRLSLYLEGPSLSVEEEDRYRSLLERRGKREPLQYIEGEVSFFGRSFTVNPDVLIPRPETELFVEEILKRTDCLRRTIDVGTGSGCIAVTLLCERPGATVLAIDLAGEALRVACTNAARHRVSDRFQALRGNLLSALTVEYRADLIVANLPYVPETTREQLQPEVRDYEPHAALFAGPDGLSLIERMIREAGTLLRPGGRLALEIGEGQGAKVRDLLKNAGGFHTIEVVQDLAGWERMAFAVRGG